MTTLPNPFLSASDGLHPLSSVAVTLGAGPTALESVTAEIQSSPGEFSASLPSGEREPSVMLVQALGEPAGSLVPAPQAPAGNFSYGDADEDLHNLQTINAPSGLSPPQAAFGWSHNSVPDLREEAMPWPASCRNSHHRSEKTSGAADAKKCGEKQETCQTDALSDLSGAGSEEPSRRASRELFEAASGDLDLSQLPRRGALDMEAGAVRHPSMTSPGSMTTAGTNTAWVRDCIELQEIQSSDGGQRPTDAAPTLGNMLHRPSSLVASGQGIDPTSPSEAFTAVERSLNHAEASSAPLLELHEFLGTGVQAPRPIGPWPRGFDPQAFLRAIEEAWIAGIDEPDPLLFLETFKLGEVA